jgi:hypothetical protein
MPLEAIIMNVGSQLWAVGEVIPVFATNRRENRRAINEAISSMRRALNRTRMFFRSPDFSNSQVLFEISELWNLASEKVGIVNPGLGRTLGEKSRFWSDHELFIATGRANDVLKLNQVVDEIDRLYQRIL